ncbi:MAG TPA: hypothetical protein VIN34_07985 [Candidatus Limnocylindria bacterium]|jgi:uncharacterized membrane protein AbrB (regulator of aidB expression)
MSARERRTWLRFLIVVVAGAAGETLGFALGLPSADLLVPLLFGGAAYYLTDGMDSPFRPRGGGQAKYWRGRRIDDN